MADRTVSVRLLAKVDAFKRDMASAGAASKKFGSDVAASGKGGSAALAEVKTGSTVAGLALLGLAGAAVGASAMFDKQMSAVQAATGESAAGMEALRQASLDAGAATVFSATEAAQGVEELAKAGLSTADIMGGALTGALDLAAAGAISVAEAAETSATALTVFGLKGSDVAHVADLLAAGAGKAQGSVSDMGMALKQSALVAKTTGLSVEDTTGALAMFASAGLIGSDAGTSFKTMLQRLVPQSDAAAAVMEQLGINAYDAGGNFIGLQAYAGKLKAGLAGLTDQQKASTLTTLYGSDAVRAAAILYDQGADGVMKWRDSVDDSGYAAEQARARLDNLAGDFEQLTGSMETAFIKTGSQANGILRSLTQGATEAVNAFGDLPGPLQASALAVTVAAGGFLVLAPRVMDSVDAFRRIETASPRAGKAMAATGKAAAKAAVLFVALEGVGLILNNISSASVNAGRGVNEMVKALESAKPEGLGFQDFANNAHDLNDALTRVSTSNAIDSIDEWAGQLTHIGSNLGRSRDAISGVDDALAAMVANGNADGAAEAASRLRDSFIAAGGTADVFDQQMSAYRDSLAAAENASNDAARGTGELSGSMSTLAGAVGEAVDPVKALNDELDRLRGTQMSADEATSNLEKALDDATTAVKDNGKAVTNHRTQLDLTSEAGRANASALQTIATAALDGVDAWVANGDSAKVVEDKTRKARDAFVDAAIQMGLTKDAAKALADKYGLIPAKVSTVVKVNSADALTEIDRVRAALAGLTRIDIPRAQAGIHRLAASSRRAAARSGASTGTSSSASPSSAPTVARSSIVRSGAQSSSLSVGGSATIIVATPSGEQLGRALLEFQQARGGVAVI